jgi:hypothetical protein
MNWFFLRFHKYLEKDEPVKLKVKRVKRQFYKTEGVHKFVLLAVFFYYIFYFELH